MSEKMMGMVKFFNADKGFGFISPSDGTEDIYVHYSVLQNIGFKTLEEGQKVEFTVKPSQKFGRQAVNVIVL